MQPMGPGRRLGGGHGSKVDVTITNLRKRSMRGCDSHHRQNRGDSRCAGPERAKLAEVRAKDATEKCEKRAAVKEENLPGRPGRPSQSAQPL